MKMRIEEIVNGLETDVFRNLHLDLIFGIQKVEHKKYVHRQMTNV